MVDPRQARIASVLEDPSATAIARTYADALLDAVPVDQVAGVLEEFASFVSEVYAGFPDFARLISSPSVSKDDKLAIIERTIANRASTLFGNFLRVLARHQRLDLLPTILDQTKRRQEIRTGQQRVEVESAVPLSEDAKQSLQQTLKAMLRTDPIVELRVDPDLIGGLRVRVGDTIYDTSLRTRLKQLQTRMRERSFHEIQSGRDRFSHHEGN
jgi:F-type H+-transporting ATPase subunit delta